MIGFLLLCALMWHSSRPRSWERPIVTAVDHIPIPVRGLWIALFAPLAFTLLTAALGCIAAAVGRRRVAVAGIVGCLGAVALSEIVFKPLVDRVRTHDVGLFVPHVVRVGSEMFPSVHVTACAAWVTFALLVIGRRSWLMVPLVALPLALGCSVMSQQLHYPADVIGGLLLGSAFTYLVVDVVLTLTGPGRPQSHPRSRQPIITE
jgi:membrane-associated phospholipid phosphatase